MEKNQAYQILNLNASASEIEIKKAYRKLFYQYHPERNDDSAESQNKYNEIQVAYELLISEQPINYQVNFGVSEAEVEELLSTEIVANFASSDLKEKFSLEEIAKIISNEED
jgi:DnaJ-class molecular chaperone